MQCVLCEYTSTMGLKSLQRQRITAPDLLKYETTLCIVLRPVPSFALVLG